MDSKHIQRISCCFMVEYISASRSLHHILHRFCSQHPSLRKNSYCTPFRYLNIYPAHTSHTPYLHFDHSIYNTMAPVIRSPVRALLIVLVSILSCVIAVPFAGVTVPLHHRLFERQLSYTAPRKLFPLQLSSFFLENKTSRRFTW